MAGGYIPDTAGIDGKGFETGDAYEGLFAGRLIIGGVLYFNRYKSGGTLVEQDVVAVDIRTGEELWVRSWNRTRLVRGQLFYWDSFNYHAVFAYLIATRTVAGVTYWDFYEASTGRWVFTYSHVPSGRIVYGPRGEIIIYTIDLTRGWMTKWNSTHVVAQRKVQLYGPVGMVHGSWIGNYFHGTTLDGRLGIMWNKTIPRLQGTVWDLVVDDIVVGTQLWGSWQTLGDTPCILWALDLRPGREGQLLYNITWPRERDVCISRTAISIPEGVFVLRAKEPRTLYGFDVRSGRQIWDPTEPLDIRTTMGGVISAIAYGKLFVCHRFAGFVDCYDVKTGKLLWKYEVKDPYGASEMWQKEFAGDMWPIRILFITDGKIYLGHSEHSPNNPLPRGAPLICLDVNTGEEIFKVYGLMRVTDWGGRPIIGDSIIVGMDTYTMQVLAIGKGPTQTTVETTKVGVSAGSTVVIEGRVLDISPGTRDPRIALRFPNGVPAVADESMGEWMLYVYKQFPRPANVKGVWVKLDAINAYTGEYLDLGGTHTDEAGFYTVAWTPPKEGLWKILATFPGSKSYYPSFAQTSIAVTPPPAPVEIPTPASPEQAQTIQAAIESINPQITFMMVLIAIAILIGIINIILYIRKK